LEDAFDLFHNGICLNGDIADMDPRKFSVNDDGIVEMEITDAEEEIE